MEREPGFLSDLERSLVAGVASNVHRTRIRRRLAAGGAAVALVGLTIGGFVVADRGGDEDVVSATSRPAATTTSQPSTVPERTVERTDPSIAPSSSLPTTSITSTTTPATSTLPDTTTTSAPTASTTTVDTAGPTVDCATVPPPSFDGFPVRRCASGWPVAWVRNALEARGEVFDGAVPEFTEEVEAAVRRFQAANGLEVDGLVGENTWFALYPEYQEVDGRLSRGDLDSDGRLEPAEVTAIADTNAICESVPEDCPPAVEDLTVDSGVVGEPMRISWTASPGAAGYRVFVTHDRSVHETQATTLELPTAAAPRIGEFAVVVEAVPGGGGQGRDTIVEYELAYNEAACLPRAVDPACVPR